METAIEPAWHVIRQIIIGLDRANMVLIQEPEGQPVSPSVLECADGEPMRKRNKQLSRQGGDEDDGPRRTNGVSAGAYHQWEQQVAFPVHSLAPWMAVDILDPLVHKGFAGLE